MKNLKCNECGAELFLSITTPEKVFSINDKYELEREDNNYSYLPPGASSYYEFVCSNDREHNIGVAKRKINSTIEGIKGKLQDA